MDNYVIAPFFTAGCQFFLIMEMTDVTFKNFRMFSLIKMITEVVSIFPKHLQTFIFNNFDRS